MRQWNKITPLFREAIAVHLILMAAGEDSANIYVATGAIAPDGRPGQLAVVVKNGYRLIITVGDCTLTSDDLSRQWPRAIRRLHKMSDEEAWILRESTAMSAQAAAITELWAHRKRAYESADA